jgi:hypothetical protein
MKNNIIYFVLVSILAVSAPVAHAQMYRTASTEALENDGRQWVEKKLPPSVITFSDYSGQVEIKAAIASLFAQNQDSATIVTVPSDTMADFTMTLDKEQIQQQQVSSGKSFTTTGLFTINNISKKITAQCSLEPRNNPSDGFTISVILRFNPSDFGMRITGETENTPLIVKVTSGYLNRLQNNF